MCAVFCLEKSGKKFDKLYNKEYNKVLHKIYANEIKYFAYMILSNLKFNISYDGQKFCLLWNKTTNERKK